MVIISLLILSLVAVAFIMRGAPKPKPPELAEPGETPHITHPWSSGAPNETDDFAGPNAAYGPETQNPDSPID
jgi:hypothetical protein